VAVSSRRITKALLTLGLLAGPLFVATFIVEGATRPFYDPARLPVSLLALGDDGWIQTVNFLLDGILLLALAIGLARSIPDRDLASRAGPMLIAVVGLGVFAAGVFSTDPGGGFPFGEPPPPESTVHATLHDVCSLMVFVGLPLAMAIFAAWFASRGDVRWAAYSAASAIAAAAGFVLFAAGFNGAAGLDDVAGWVQRAVIVVGWGWMSLLAAHMLRLGPPSSASDLSDTSPDPGASPT
jgi:hypothetical protein